VVLDVVPAVVVAHDHRDRIRLDDQVAGEPSCLIGGGVRGRLIWISDGDQISHGAFPSSDGVLWSADLAFGVTGIPHLPASIAAV
jgi:hypothetical protein